MANLKMCLCEGRHEIPEAVDGAIFCQEIQDVTNVSRLEIRAFNSLWDACYKHSKTEPGFLCSPLSAYDEDGEGADTLQICRGLRLDLYVTGLTVALIAALNVCRREGVKVTLWHFDHATGNYYPQEVA